MRPYIMIIKRQVSVNLRPTKLFLNTPRAIFSNHFWGMLFLKCSSENTSVQAHVQNFEFLQYQMKKRTN